MKLAQVAILIGRVGKVAKAYNLPWRSLIVVDFIQRRVIGNVAIEHRNGDLGASMNVGALDLPETLPGLAHVLFPPSEDLIWCLPAGRVFQLANEIGLDVFHTRIEPHAFRYA